MARAVPWVAFAILVPAITGADELNLVTEPARIERGAEQQWSAGPLPTAGSTVLLEFTARTDAASCSGSTYMIKLFVNDHLVTAAKTRRLTRLLNKPLSFVYSPELTLLWQGSGGWRIVYAPDFDAANRIALYQGEAYRFVLDVTDLINADANNAIKIEHTGTASLAKSAGGEIPVFIGMMKLGTEAGESPMVRAADVLRQPINRGEPGAGPAEYDWDVPAAGGFVLTVAGVRYPFETRLSYPNAGFNHLEPTAESTQQGRPAWRVSVKLGDGAAQVIGEGPDYELRREITFAQRRVDIADTIINRHADAPLGLIVRSQVALEGDPRVHLAGDPDPARARYYSPANPSVYVAGADHGLGIICQDDVFRNQATLLYDAEENAAGVMTDKLYLPPGGQHTLRWSVYPVASDDYFDFINLVRADWGSNFTVVGPWAFFSPDTIIDTPLEDLQAMLDRLDINYMVYCGGWVDWKNDKKEQKTIGFGTYVLGDYWASFRRRLHDAIEKLHQARPGVKCLVYYDTQRDSWPDAPDRYPDSRLVNSKGQQLSTEWGGRYTISWSMVATLENSFGKAMLDALDVYLDEIGADGIYWDEMECVSYGGPLITHSMPDGFSCALDADTFTVDHEIGVTTLLGEGHRLAVIDKVRSKGGFLMGNCPTMTRDILGKQVQRMVEVQHNDSWCYEGNLDTPLGYASGRMDFGNFVRGVDLAALLVGTRYTYEHEVEPHLFPFTPIELHAGYLLGEERIIATHSGSYGWPGECCLARVLRFDGEGKIVDNEFLTTIGTEARTKVELAEGEMVVLKRLPVTLTPKGGTAVVANVAWSEELLSLVVNSQRGCTLRLADGELEVPPGRQTVRLDR